MVPPAWANHLVDPSATDLKSATPPAISSPEYVSKLEATLTPEESAKLKELDPNGTVPEARLLARSSSTPPSSAGRFKDRENSSKHSSSSSDVPPEMLKPSKILAETPQKSPLDCSWHDLAAEGDKGQPPEMLSNPPVHHQGRVFRALTGGDTCVATLDVPGHFHAGHAPFPQARPASAVSLTAQQPSPHGQRNPESKPGPAVNEPNEGLQPAPVDIKPGVKHQPSNYWGFSFKPNNLEDLPLDKIDAESTAVISAPKPTDGYGPPDVGNQHFDRELAPSSDQDSLRYRHSQEQNAEGPHGPPDSTTAPKEDAKEPGRASLIQKRTTLWLNDTLRHPDPNGANLPQLPSNTTGRRNTFPGNLLWGRQKDPSTPQPLSRHSLDHRYKSTVNDLENIMDSAVQLAREAMEHFGSKSTNGSKGGKLSESHHQDTGSDLSGDSRHKKGDMPKGTIMVPVPQRISSLLRLGAVLGKKVKSTSPAQSADRDKVLPTASSDGNGKPLSGPRHHCPDVDRWSLKVTPSDLVNFPTQYSLVQAAADSNETGPGQQPVHTNTMPLGPQDIELQERNTTGPDPQRPGVLNLRGRSHVSLRGIQAFSLARSHPRQPIARDWSKARKRYVASVACMSTALIGVLVGIYAGLVPSIQYYIVDLNHYAILGNVVFYFGLAIPSFFFWPLPLLHGRKPYILSSLVIAMPLLFPQAISVSQVRSPYTSEWR